MLNVQGDLLVLDQKMVLINDLNRQILDSLLDSESTDTNVDTIVEEADKMYGRYNRLKFRVEGSLNKMKDSSSVSSSQQKRSVKLPKIELKKFGGEIKDWILFWSQFERIHEDELIENSDKFQYLIQATIPKSRARQLVESYPPISDNYPKVIQSLKSRFGRDDLLVEFYVRELLKLILNNLNNKIDLSSLYDRMESQLRSLDTLGVTSDKCAAMLYPLVESCLPGDILRAWQRSKSFDHELNLKSQLEELMKFLKKEVESEERISLAANSFDIPIKKKEMSSRDRLVPTASGLINQPKVPICVFCKNSHLSENCVNAQKLSLSEKIKKLTEKGCCHSCLKFGHLAKRCFVKKTCTQCRGKHVTLMCPKRHAAVDETLPCVNIPEQPIVENLTNNTYHETFLQTLVVNLVGKSKTRCIRVLIDTGSQKSYISSYAAIEMKYESTGTEQLIHSLFGGSQTEAINHTRYKIHLENLNKQYKCNFDALDQPVICGNVVSAGEGPWKSELQQLGIEISDTSDGPIDVLIGADVAGKLFTGCKYILKCGLVAMETSLGWILMGKAKIDRKEIGKSSSFSVTSLLCQHNTISDLWKLDVLGISDPGERKTKEELEQETMKQFLESITINKEGRYEVNLTWVEDHPPLPTNYNLAEIRLNKLMEKLSNDGYYEMYDNVLKEWMDEGIIENVTNIGLSANCHYLPHRHVVKLNSATTKLRPVFDASANEKSHPSLNQCLKKGLNFIELIPSILIRFRLSKIGVISDIRKAFLQISLKENDRDFLRFLWNDECGERRIFRHSRVVFGVNCSPFLLGAVIDFHLRKTLENISVGTSSYTLSTISKLLDSFYVDNCVASVDCEDELRMFIKESTQVMAEAKFDLRGWEYNVSYTETDSKTSLSPVLGLNWDRKQDSLELNFDWFRNLNFDLITKRTILSTTHRLFDPIGFSCPVQICPRILLQKTWMLNISWDNPVPEEMKKEFLCWLNELQILRNLKIPRWVSQTTEAKQFTIHMFCDASQEAYATAIFLRSESIGDVHIQLIQAKNRISPLSKLTIPRMELLAATIGARLLRSVLDNMGKHDVKVYCWTDSTTVLSWIRREDQWKTFVWNRVQEIRKLTEKENWYHVPGEMNPADLPSRGCSPKHLLESKWWEGPKWLMNIDEWPTQNYEVFEKVIVEERKKNTSTLLSTQYDYSHFYRYFSNYSQIVNLIGWMKRFSFNCLNTEKRKGGNLSLEEFQDAEKRLLKMVQQEQLNNCEDKIIHLCPFEDRDGILRLKTRITERKDTQDFLTPILLPSKHPVVDRLIYSYHIQNCHIGIQGLLCLLRERFWILNGRKAVRRVISKCVVCCRYNSRKLDENTAPLPESRVRDASVFEIIGMDFAGPLYVRNKEKVWICIFTCAIYRAVHLEVLSTLSTDGFLQIFRKYVARRGRPLIIYSDNATNFVGAENAMSSIDWDKIVEFSVAKRIEWRFNPSTAAWWGGWWERLIRILKQLLRKVLGRTSLSLDELSAVVCDCEAIMNSRPLTYISEDNNDLLPLTPAMFLQEIKEIGTPELDVIDANSLRKRWRYRQKLREDLRKRFRIEYLSTLRTTPKKCQPRDVKVGDVYLIENENSKRLDWPLGRIEEVFIGRDGRIRLVKLKTSRGSLLRPIQRIFPLEFDTSDEHSKFKADLSKRRKEEGSPNPDDEKTDQIRKDAEEVVTKSGRRVKPPLKFTP